MFKERVQSVLEEIRPMLQNDGGDVELDAVDEKEGVVSVRLVGACGSCPMALMTLQFSIEKTLIEKIPEVKRVVQVQ